eukprot:TRINITY_DN18528_c0_g1_i2.p1 TRINITY_DN18528_c0_g1~~TRINITY_DN18528_c0_g1_i2.p1  ORF type:complete len:289 (-),score=101.48 TRINITY_DN18528_c0_g1_i2:137-1003(-)
MAAINEVGGKLEASEKARRKMEQEYLMLQTSFETLQKENEALHEKLEDLKFDLSNSTEISKDYQKVRKDREILLEMTAKAQDMAPKLEELKKQNATLQEELTALREAKIDNSKQILDLIKSLDELKQRNLELERKQVHQEEKINILQEEKETMEGLIKEIMKHSKFQKDKSGNEEIKQEKIILQKEELSHKKEELVCKESQLKEAHKQIQNLTQEKNIILKVWEKKQKELIKQYEEEIEDLGEQLQSEKTAAKEGLQVLSEINKRQEKLFITAINDIGGYINLSLIHI